MAFSADSSKFASFVRSGSNLFRNWMVGRVRGLWGKDILHADWLKYSCVLDDLMSLQKVTEDSATLLAYSQLHLTACGV